MTPTQIIEIDTLAAPATIRVREDARELLVVLTVDGRPVELLRMSPPADRILSSRDVRPSNDHQFAWRAPAPSRHPDPLSVVICTHERPDDLGRCLESLTRVREDGHEVIVIDNAPVTDRTGVVAREFGVRYVVEPSLGLNRARNTGINAATHGIVAFVDDDVVVGRAWLAAVDNAFLDPDVGCVTGLVLPLELETPGQEEFELYCQHRRDLQRRVYSRKILRSSAAGVVGMGANMAFRRDLVLELGGFDPRLGPPTRTRAADETDMFARVLDSGRLIVYTPDAQVWHRHRRSAHEVRSCIFGYGVGVYSFLTKRLFEERDLGSIVTAGRWFVGPVMKVARAKALGRPAPRWNTVLAETTGAAIGPFCFAYEVWRSRRRALGSSTGHIHSGGQLSTHGSTQARQLQKLVSAKAMTAQTWNHSWDRIGHSADTLRTLVGRELNIRYKGSLLGMLWAILSPLGTVGVLFLLFTKILPLNIPQYATFIYCGLLPWTWFQSAVQSGATALNDNRDLVKQPFFPRIVLPAVVTGTNSLLYLMALPVLALLAAVDGVSLTAAVLWLPFVWIALGIFTLACTILFAAVGLLVRDIPHMLGVALLLWFYVTPVFYDVSQIAPGAARWLYLNPLTAIVQAHRAIVLHGQAPDWSGLAFTSVAGLALALLSSALFRSLEGTLVERV